MILSTGDGQHGIGCWFDTFESTILPFGKRQESHESDHTELDVDIAHFPTSLLHVSSVATVFFVTCEQKNVTDY
jgi:hypothetical protein